MLPDMVRDEERLWSEDENGVKEKNKRYKTGAYDCSAHTAGGVCMSAGAASDYGVRDGKRGVETMSVSDFCGGTGICYLETDTELPDL